MAWGVIPIVSKLARITDVIVRDGYTGLLVPVGEVTQFVEALESLAKSKERIQMLSAAAWAYANESLRKETMAEAYGALLKQLSQAKQTEKAIPRDCDWSADKLLSDYGHLPMFLGKALVRRDKQRAAKMR